MVSLSLMSFGDADGFDAWSEDAVENAFTAAQPAVAFNAIVMSMLESAPCDEVAVPAPARLAA